MAVATTGGQAAVTHLGAMDASAVQDLQDTFNQGRAQVLIGAADAIPFPSLVILNGSGVDAATLASPVVGPQPVGDDGKTITIVDAGGHAHTVTTAANKINGGKHIGTFNGTQGSSVEFQAWNGIWYATLLNGVALT
jgi:hypothetical protein